MLNTTDKIIKHKVGLLNLAEELGNIYGGPLRQDKKIIKSRCLISPIFKPQPNKYQLETHHLNLDVASGNYKTQSTR